MLNKKNSSRSLILSKHLTTVRTNTNQLAIVNRDNGMVLAATHDFLSFLDQFQSPISIDEAIRKFKVENLNSKIKNLIEKKFLLDLDYDQEIEYIEKNDLADEKNIISTENLLIYFPEDVIYPIPYFCELLEKVYSSIIERGFKKLLRKSIVLVCENKQEFKILWGRERLPENVEYFVSHGRILAVKPGIIYSLAIANETIFRAMTHEMTHIFLCENYTNLPIWCVEGLCEYYCGNRYNISFKQLIGSKKMYRFSELSRLARHSMFDIDSSTIEYNIGYRQSVCFISFLVDLLGESELLKCVLSTGLSKPFEKTFANYFNDSLESYEIAWRKTLGFV